MASKNGVAAQPEAAKKDRVDNALDYYMSTLKFPEVGKDLWSDLSMILSQYDRLLYDIDQALDASQPHGYTGKIRIAFWSNGREIEPYIIAWINTDFEYAISEKDFRKKKEAIVKGKAFQGQRAKRVSRHTDKIRAEKKVAPSIYKWRSIRLPLNEARRYVRTGARNGWALSETRELVKRAVETIKRRAQTRAMMSQMVRNVANSLNWGRAYIAKEKAQVAEVRAAAEGKWKLQLDQMAAVTQDARLQDADFLAALQKRMKQPDADDPCFVTGTEL